MVAQLLKHGVYDLFVDVHVDTLYGVDCVVGLVLDGVIHPDRWRGATQEGQD